MQRLETNPLMPHKDLERRREYQRAWVEQNPDYQAAWYERNRERLNARKATQKRIRWKANPEKYRAMGRKGYNKRRERADFRILQNLRMRIRKAIRGISKSARTLELLGMELKEFRIYVQGQFRPGMTWENYGPVWHIDHVRPCASFDLTDPAQQRICFNWENLQPLFAKENFRKGAKFVFA